MKKKSSPVLIVLFVPLLASVANAEDTSSLRAEAVQIVQSFAGELKPALMAAMSEGGPVHAIEVCAKRAPAIAGELSKETGWNVRRVSLKPRNAVTAIPDAWAVERLQRFEDSDERVADDVVGNTYHFIKAQPVEPVCLACHGKSVAPEVTSRLDEKYPRDIATGYELGDIRGAFYLTKDLLTKDLARDL